MDRSRVAGMCGNIPAVAGPDIRFLMFDPKGHVSRDEIPGLLVGVGVLRELGSLVEPELRHERVLPEDEGLLPDAGQRVPETGVGVGGNHEIRRLGGGWDKGWGWDCD